MKNGKYNSFWIGLLNVTKRMCRFIDMLKQKYFVQFNQSCFKVNISKNRYVTNLNDTIISLYEVHNTIFIAIIKKKFDK